MRSIGRRPPLATIRGHASSVVPCTHTSGSFVLTRWEALSGKGDAGAAAAEDEEPPAAAAAAGAASLVNLVVNGDIIMPNAGIYLSPPTSSILKQSSDYGTVNGEVTGQSSAVAASGGSVTVYKVGALVDSVEKSAGYTKSSVISPYCHFMFKLPSGVYRIIVVYPNGKDQIIENYAMWPGSHTSLNLIYLE